MAYKLPALMLALAACGTVSDDDPSQAVSDDPAAEDPSTPGAEGTTFRYFTALADGTPQNVFASLDDAYLSAGGKLDVAPGDYYFSVTYQVCPPGTNQDQFFPQQSPLACRTFGVGANGLITRGVAQGGDCLHANGVGANGGITVGLMPFEVTSYACGTFVAHVIPAGELDSPLNAVATLFFNAPIDPPAPGPVCGNGVVEDGEACDDGNEADHDGCSALCQIEPDCHPLQQ